MTHTSRKIILEGGSGGNSAGVWANLPGSQANLSNTNTTLGGPGGGNFGIKATSGTSATSNGVSVLVDAIGGHNIGVLAMGGNRNVRTHIGNGDR